MPAFVDKEYLERLCEASKRSSKNSSKQGSTLSTRVVDKHREAALVSLLLRSLEYSFYLLY
jgi:hypothetical protein